MRKLKKEHLVVLSLGLCIIAFIVPFILSSCENTLFEVLTLSLTAVGAIAMIVTMLIAIFLYDRFGLEAKFIEKQTDKVLELADLLKGKTITVFGEGGSYYIRPSRSQLTTFNSFPNYKVDCKKIILLSLEDSEKALKEIVDLKRSYWLPKVIREKMEFLEIRVCIKVDNPSDESFVTFNFNFPVVGNMIKPLPEMTFEDFNRKLRDLVQVIEEWLEKHSEIPIDLKLEEPNQFIPK